MRPEVLWRGGDSILNSLLLVAIAKRMCVSKENVCIEPQRSEEAKNYELHAAMTFWCLHEGLGFMTSLDSIHFVA